MNWFTSKYRILASELSAQVTELTQELNAERARRIAAEAIAEERRVRADQSDDYARRAEASRDEAVKSKADSIDLVNTTLLKAMTPEGPPPRDIKDFSPLAKKRAIVPFGRRAERLFVQKVIEKQNSSKKPADPTAAANAQMAAIAVDNLIQ